MTRYFAFLRAINVGGHTVKMDYLKSLFESCGFTGVETFIASGNVIFDSPLADDQKITQTIESCLKEKLGYPVSTFVRTAEDLSAIINYQPFPDSGDANIYIAFLASTPDAQVRDKLYANNSTDNHFQIHGPGSVLAVPDPVQRFGLFRCSAGKNTGHAGDNSQPDHIAKNGNQILCSLIFAVFFLRGYNLKDDYHFPKRTTIIYYLHI